MLGIRVSSVIRKGAWMAMAWWASQSLVGPTWGQEVPDATVPPSAESATESSTPLPASAVQKGVEAGSAEATALYGDAANLQNNREFALAVEEWTKFLKQFPEDDLGSRVCHYRGVCRMQIDQLADAIADFDRGLDDKALPADLREEGLLNLGWCHYNLGAGGDQSHLPAAIASFDEMLKDFPKSPLSDQALFYAGEASYLQSKLPDAIGYYERLVQGLPKSERWPDAAYALGVALQDAGRHDDALKVFETFQQTHPGHELSNEMQLRRGESLLMKKEYASAEPIFAALVSLKDFAAADHALFRQAFCAVAQQKYAEAAQLFAALPAHFPKSAYAADAWVSAGNGFYRAEMWDDALRAYAEARKVKPELTADMAHWTCRVLLKQQQGPEALRVARAALEKVENPELKVQLLYDEADAMYAQPDQRRGALDAYKNLGESHKDNPLAGQSLYNAAYAALDLHEFVQCQQLCDEFIRDFPKHELLADVQHLMAETSLQQGNAKDAESAFAKLIEAFPEHPEVDSWRVQVGRALLAQSAYDQVIDRLTDAIPSMSSAASIADAWLLVGDSQAHLKKYDEAKVSLQRSLKAYPRWRNTDRTLLRLASVSKDLGKADEARHYLETLVKDYPQSNYMDRVELVLGDLDFRDGKLDGADQHYARVSKDWPESEAVPLARLGAGWVKLRRGSLAEAEQLFTQVLDVQKTGSVAWEARQARTVARHRQKKFADALDDAKWVIEANPQGAKIDDTRYIMALCQTATDQKVAALDTLNSIVTDSPTYRRLDLVLYELAWQQRETAPEQSLLRFKELAEKFPNSPHAAESRFHEAEALYAQKDFASAESLYQGVVDGKARPEIREKAIYKRGWAAYHQEKWEAARLAFGQLEKDFPDGRLTVDGRFMVGEAWFMEKNFAQALEIFDQLRGVEMQSESSANLLKLHAGQAAQQLGKHEVAVEWLHPLLELQGELAAKWQAKFETAQALRHLDRKREATAEFAEIADHNRDALGAQSRFMLGELLFGDKDFPQAVREFQRLMYGYGGASASSEIRVWQVKGGLEAGRCAAVVAEQAKSEKEQTEWSQRATKCFEFVIEQQPNSPEAAIAKEQIDKLAPTGRLGRSK